MSRLLPVLAGLAVGVLAAAGAAQAACSCPTPATVKQFDAPRYLGTWLEMRRVARSMEQGGQCGTAHYSWTDANNKTVDVANTNYLTEKAATRTVNLLATPTDLAAGKFTVSWPKYPQVPDSMYWVLGTDYVKYAVVYSCGEPSSPSGLPSITLWVLARSLKDYEDSQKAVQDVLDNSGLPTDALEDVHQTSCPADTCSACPGSVKADLDLDKLAGRWWEVQHGIFSKGGAKQGCSRNLVSKTDDGVQIDLYTAEYSDKYESTNVNKSLSAKWTDSSKKNGDFSITQGFSGDAADRLCVLGTDYDNWAVISICAKQKTSTTPADDLSLPSTGGVWVLSRKRGLTAEHQIAANKAVTDAGLPVADLAMTPSTPCAAAALEDDSSAAAAVTPLVLLVSVLAAAARLF